MTTHVGMGRDCLGERGALVCNPRSGSDDLGLDERSDLVCLDLGSIEAWVLKLSESCFEIGISVKVAPDMGTSHEISVLALFDGGFCSRPILAADALRQHLFSCLRYAVAKLCSRPSRVGAA